MKKEFIYSKEDKLKWFGDGEWIDEPDLITFKSNGLNCLVKRIVAFEQSGHSFGGHLCGYVDFPKDKQLDNFPRQILESNFLVHGGITCDELIDGIRRLGFDCAHMGDLLPSYKTLSIEIPSLLKGMYNATYKNVNYAMKECRDLAKQMRSVEEL